MLQGNGTRSEADMLKASVLPARSVLRGGGCLELFLDRSTGRLRALWRLGIQYWTYWVLVQLIFSLIVVAWLLAGSGERIASGGLDTSVVSGSSALPLVSGVAGLSAAILTVWLAGRLLDRRPFSAFGFRLGAGWWLDLLFGMVLGALLMTTVFLIELGLGWVEVTGFFETQGGAPFVISMLLPVAAFLCVGVSEETVFRGYQLKNTAEGLNHPALGHLLGLLRRATRRQPERHAHKHAQHSPRRPDARLRVRALRRAGDPHRFAYHLELLSGRSLRLPCQRLRSFRCDSPDYRAGRPSTLDRWIFRPRGWLANPRHNAPWDVSRRAVDTPAHRQRLTPHPHSRESLPQPATDTIPLTRCSWSGANLETRYRQESLFTV